MYTSMRNVENLIGIEFSDKFGKNCHVSNTVFTFKNISIKKNISIYSMLPLHPSVYIIVIVIQSTCSLLIQKCN